MVYLVDIDNTICKTEGTDYLNSVPVPLVINKINDLYEQGHTIKIFTGRGSRSGKNWRAFTEQQLKSWGVKYNELIFGKPHCDIILDDKAIEIRKWING